MVILTNFHAWSSFSKKGDYAEMLAMCINNAEFAEISSMCKRSGKIGIRFYYEFKRLVVVSMMDEGREALVKGEIKLIQPGSGIVFNGHFRASCHLVVCHTTNHGSEKPEDWKLGDIDIEWED